MNLTEYFTHRVGTGVLATSDAAGRPNAAVYSRPYIIDEHTVAFSMLERRSYANIRVNPRAAYMFLTDGRANEGVRLYLEVAGEETDPDRIAAVKAQHASTRTKTDAPRHLVLFKVVETRPLIGDGPA